MEKPPLKRQVTFLGNLFAELEQNYDDTTFQINIGMEYDKPLSLVELRELVETNFFPDPKWRNVLRQSSKTNGFEWVELSRDEVDIKDHVVLAEEKGLTISEFLNQVILAKRSWFDENRPPWKFFVLDTGVVAIFSHSIGDGASILAALLKMGQYERPVIKRSKPRHEINNLLKFWFLLVSLFNALIRPIFDRSDSQTSLRKRSGPRATKFSFRRCELGIAELKKKGGNFTINDKLLALLSRTCVKYMKKKGDYSENLRVHAMMPFDLRKDHNDLGNVVSMTKVRMPLEPTFEGTASQIEQRTLQLKNSIEPWLSYWVNYLGCHYYPNWFTRRYAHHFFHSSTLTLTNVRGVEDVVTMSSSKLLSIACAIKPLSQSIFVAALSYHGKIYLSFTFDQNLIDDELFMQCFDKQVKNLDL